VLPSPPRRAPWQLSYLALAAIWGCSFWWMKVGLSVLTPIQVAAARVVLGFAVLLTASKVTSTPLPRGRATWGHLAVVGAGMTAIPFTLISFGETKLSSVLAGLINSLVPVATLLMVVFAFREERPDAERTAGVALGFGGVLVVLEAWRGVPGGELVGVVSCLGAVACYGFCFPYVRRFLQPTGLRPMQLATGQLATGAAVGLLLLIISQLAGAPFPTAWPSWGVLGALAGLGVLGSGLAYVLNFAIIGAAGPTVASTVTYVVPIFATIAGVVFLHEQITWAQPVGAGIILLGVAMAQGRLRPKRRPTAP